MKYVFVYGTLRAGEINDINLAADRHAIARPRHLGLTSLSGRLFDFGTYPGMVAGTHDDAAIQADQPARVVGDVYESTMRCWPCSTKSSRSIRASTGCSSRRR
ncbi:gamma-glutamylcyclotransferase (GGCT)/AIG2-like uncharacterized protein YtfP [Paraburkholderia tropica]|nr:gamma-glutamylcyclotransferase (GGCT)/AIG2-like uncharacterized protein YtfP [Paraburkholderia tropica]